MFQVSLSNILMTGENSPKIKVMSFFQVMRYLGKEDVITIKALNENHS